MLFTLERIEADVAAFGGGIKGHVRLVASVSAIAESLLDDIAAFMRDPANRDIKVDIEERFSRDVVRLVARRQRVARRVLGQRRLRGPAAACRIAATSSRWRSMRIIRWPRRKSVRFEQTLELRACRPAAGHARCTRCCSVPRRAPAAR